MLGHLGGSESVDSLRHLHSTYIHLLRGILVDIALWTLPTTDARKVTAIISLESQEDRNQVRNHIQASVGEHPH